MKKTLKKSNSTDELRDHYDFDYSRAKPNRFAGRIDKNRVVVVLDSDVAKVFKTPDAVNHALRTLVSALPQNGRKARS